MFVLKIEIFYKWKNESTIEAIKNTELPDEVSCIWNKVEDTESFIMPDNCYSILITDDHDLLPKADVSDEYMMLVYGGDPKYAMPYAKKIDQFWGYYDTDTIKVIFLKLVRNFKARFDAYYNKMMMTTLMDSSPDMMWFKNADGLHLEVNTKFTEVVGKTKEQCRNAPHEYIWNVEPDTDLDDIRCINSETEVMESGKTIALEEMVQIGDDIKQLMTYKAPLIDPFGKVIGTSGIGHDMTDLNNMGLEFSILLENIPLPVLLCDRDFNTIRMNANFKDILHMSTNEIATFSYMRWIEETFEPLSETIHQETRTSHSREVRGIINDEEKYYIIIEQEIHDYLGKVTGYYCVFLDNTFRRRYEQSIIESANTDSLTGLRNRRYFYEYIQQQKGSPMTLLYIDLDNFKEVNDRLGHARGDEVLKTSAEYIKDAFSDGLAVRLGGDEFAVILVGVYDGKAVNDKCIELDKRITTLIPNESFSISASIGMVQTDGRDVDIDAFVHEGDISMYEVKRQRHEDKTS